MSYAARLHGKQTMVWCLCLKFDCLLRRLNEKYSGCKRSVCGSPEHVQPRSPLPLYFLDAVARKCVSVASGQNDGAGRMIVVMVSVSHTGESAPEDDRHAQRTDCKRPWWDNGFWLLSFTCLSTWPLSFVCVATRREVRQDLSYLRSVYDMINQNFCVAETEKAFGESRFNLPEMCGFLGWSVLTSLTRRNNPILTIRWAHSSATIGHLSKLLQCDLPHCLQWLLRCLHPQARNPLLTSDWIQRLRLRLQTQTSDSEEKDWEPGPLIQDSACLAIPRLGELSDCTQVGRRGPRRALSLPEIYYPCWLQTHQQED